MHGLVDWCFCQTRHLEGRPSQTVGAGDDDVDGGQPAVLARPPIGMLCLLLFSGLLSSGTRQIELPGAWRHESRPRGIGPTRGHRLASHKERFL